MSGTEKYETMVETIQGAVREAEERGFQAGVQYVMENFAVIKRDAFADWAKGLVSHVRVLEDLDESGALMEDDDAEMEEEEPPPPPRKPALKSASKKKPEAAAPKRGRKKADVFATKKSGLQITPEQASAIEKEVERRSKAGSPDDVNW